MQTIHLQIQVDPSTIERVSRRATVRNGLALSRGRSWREWAVTVAHNGLHVYYCNNLRVAAKVYQGLLAAYDCWGALEVPMPDALEVRLANILDVAVKKAKRFR